LGRVAADTGAILTGLTQADITARGTGPVLARLAYTAITGTVGPTIAGAEAIAISGTTDRGGSCAPTLVTQPLAMGAITTTLVGRWGIGSKDGIAEVGTGTVTGKSETRK